jgi:hypothetical protein
MHRTALPQRIESLNLWGLAAVFLLPRRAGLAVAVVAAAICLNLAAPRTDAAVPETVVGETSRQVDAAELALTHATAPSSAARPCSLSTATTAIRTR